MIVQNHAMEEMELGLLLWAFVHVSATRMLTLSADRTAEIVLLNSQLIMAPQ